MNIQIITSSYPAAAGDPGGTAGLFVRDFAQELARRGHTVVVQPAGRKKSYAPDPPLIIEPTPWTGGDRELASMSLCHPGNWPVFCRYLWQGIRTTRRINARYRIDRALCMWAVPSGLIAFLAQRGTSIPYDVWALGSDIWKIGRIPFLGRALLGPVLNNAQRLYADGVALAEEVRDISGSPCAFLPSTRTLPAPRTEGSREQGVNRLLFVGRYHANKGPDLLVEAIALLPQQARRSLKLDMFGMGPLEDKLRAMIAEAGLEDCIELHGAIAAQEFADCLQQVSFLVIPSRVESIPVVFSDALQIGTPVISMPVGDLPGIIGELGCGLLAGEVSAPALSRAIAEAIASEQESFRDGVAAARARFDLSAAVSRWLDQASAPGDPQPPPAEQRR